MIQEAHGQMDRINSLVTSSDQTNYKLFLRSQVIPYKLDTLSNNAQYINLVYVRNSTMYGLLFNVKVDWISRSCEVSSMLLVKNLSVGMILDAVAEIIEYLTTVRGLRNILFVLYDDKILDAMTSNGFSVKCSLENYLFIDGKYYTEYLVYYSR